jgi:phage/plasmid-associated DNA primase
MQSTENKIETKSAEQSDGKNTTPSLFSDINNIYSKSLKNSLIYIYKTEMTDPAKDPANLVAYEERPDPRAVYYMKEMTLPQYTKLIGKRCSNDAERRELFGKMKRYINTQFQCAGKMKVGYKNDEYEGRLFKTDNGIQGHMRELRAVMFRKTTTDVDAQNCHPNIIRWLCRKHEIRCPQLDYYCENRDACLKAINKPREDAKQAYQRIPYKYPKTLLRNHSNKERRINSPHLNDYDDEFSRIQQEFHKIPEYAKFYEAVPDDKRDNILGCGLNRIITHFENTMLKSMQGVCKDEDLKICCLMMDGLMVYGDHYKDADLLGKMSARCWKDMGLAMQFSFKEHDDIIQIPQDFECPIEIETKVLIDTQSTPAVEQMLKLLNANSVSDVYYELRGSKLKHIGGDTWYKFNENRKLWVEVGGSTLNHQMIESLSIIIENEVGKKQAYCDKLEEDPEAVDKVKAVRKQIQEIKDLQRRVGDGNFITMVRTKLLAGRCEDLTFKSRLNKAINQISISDGQVLNLTTMELRPRTDEDEWSFESPCVLLNPDDPQIKFGEKYFTDMFPNEGIRQVVLNAIKTTITGVPIRTIFFHIGKGNNGKSLLLDLIRKMFPVITDLISKNVIVKQKNDSKLTTELENLQFIRFGQGSELSETDLLHEDNVKQITGDGILNYRGMRKTDATISVACTLHYASNNMVECSLDHAIMKRMYPILYEVAFEIRPEFKDECYANLSGIFTYLMTQGKIQRVFETDTAPKELQAFKKDLFDGKDQYKSFIEERCIPSATKYLDRSHFIEQFRQWGITNYGREFQNPTSTKVGKNLARLNYKVNRSNGVYKIAGLDWRPYVEEEEEVEPPKPKVDINALKARGRASKDPQEILILAEQIKTAMAESKTEMA